MIIGNVYAELIKFSQGDDNINGYIKKLIYNLILSDLYKNEPSLKGKIQKDFNIDNLEKDLEISKREVFYNTNEQDKRESVAIIKNEYPVLYNFAGGDDFFSHLSEPLENIEPDIEDYSDDTKIYKDDPNIEENYDPLAKTKYCFIATEVYGDINHYNVIKLRKFRNNVLLKNIVGRKFVIWYYKNGRTFANTIKPFPILKRAMRFILDIFLMSQ